ncbi:MAG: HAMP domain-containing histidine kinase [Gammaproteobacteria bacterium]|nr:HAMP domain-containing histidine kinase [Gammaproteobacteria bacterium]
MSIRLTLAIILFLSIAFFGYQEARHQQQNTDNLTTNNAMHHLYSQQALHTRVLQVHFKKQVQEWKDFLLRGHSPADREKYWQQMLQEEHKVTQTAQLLHDLLSENPSIQQIIARFQKEHLMLGKKYREAKQLYLQTKINPHIVADTFVRGMDRRPTDLLDIAIGMTTIHWDNQQEKSFQQEIEIQQIQSRVFTLSLFLWFLLTAILVKKYILNPIQYATSIATDIGQGKFGNEIKQYGGKETRLLLNAMNTMQSAISHNTQLLIQQNHELESAYKKAEISNITKSNFIANMTHELRTPINGIHGALQLIHLGENNHEELNSYLKIIDQSSKNLSHIINNILLYTKISTDDFVASKQKYVLQEIINNTIDVHTKEAAKKGISLTKNIDSNISIYNDATLFNEAINQLLKNAVTFTNTGKIEISAKHQGNDQLVVTIKDTGIGMPKEKINYLLQPFTQNEENSNRSYGGTGLGLAIVKRIVILLSGEMKIISDTNQGTEVTISIPTEC